MTEYVAIDLNSAAKTYKPILSAMLYQNKTKNLAYKMRMIMRIWNDEIRCKDEDEENAKWQQKGPDKITTNHLLFCLMAFCPSSSHHWQFVRLLHGIGLKGGTWPPHSRPIFRQQNKFQIRGKPPPSLTCYNFPLP